MKRNISPIPFTCPKINEVKGCIENAISFIEDYAEENGGIIFELVNALEVLEEIRNANEGLREWGEENANEIEKLNDEIDDKKYIISSFENEIDELNDKIKDLENEIDGLS